MVGAEIFSRVVPLLRQPYALITPEKHERYAS